MWLHSQDIYGNIYKRLNDRKLFRKKTTKEKFNYLVIKFVFSKKDEIFTVDLRLNVKSMVKILSIFVAFLENRILTELLQFN